MTPELAELRLGKLTASMAAVIMGGLDTDGLKKYISQLAGERVYGDLGDERYQSKAMARGNEVEAEGLDWYEWKNDCVLDRGPHIVHPTIPYVAATPDAVYWKKRRSVEAKSPLFTTWMEVFLRGQVPSQYRWQCRWQMWCLGFEECHFVAWHRGPGGYIVPFFLDQSDRDQMQERAALVNARVEELVAQLRGDRA